MLYPASPGLNGKVALLEIENGNMEQGVFLLDSIVHRHPEFSEMVLAAGGEQSVSHGCADGAEQRKASQALPCPCCPPLIV